MIFVSSQRFPSVSESVVRCGVDVQSACSRSERFARSTVFLFTLKTATNIKTTMSLSVNFFFGSECYSSNYLDGQRKVEGEAYP